MYTKTFLNFLAFDVNALFGTKCKEIFVLHLHCCFLLSSCVVSTEVPHFRYTDGTTYLKEASSPERTGE